MPLPMVAGHAQVEDEDGDEVEESRKQHGLRGPQHTRGDHGGDGVGGVVEAVHEVEHDGQGHQHDHDP